MLFTTSDYLGQIQSWQNHMLINSLNVYQYMEPITWNNSNLCCFAQDNTCCDSTNYFTQYYTQDNINVNQTIDLIVRAVNGNNSLPYWMQTGSSGLSTLRNDILYGSFRINVLLPADDGSCFAMYYFNNTKSEIDIESLGRQASVGKVNVAIQPELRDTRGNSLNVSHQFLTGSNLTTSFHEYRFDWFQSHVDFYLDSNYQFNFTVNVPNVGGRIFIKHWTNGNPAWTLGPPINDLYVKISSMEFYFNQTVPKTMTTAIHSTQTSTISKPTKTSSSGQKTSKAIKMSCPTLTNKTHILLMTILLFGTIYLI